MKLKNLGIFTLTVLLYIREFDGSIIKKTFAGRINPVLFLSIFSFLYILFYVIV